MDTKVFSYFMALERSHGYARAAAELHISPQGLNSSMRRLESDLGVPLLDTSHGVPELTAYGKLFLECAQQVQDSLTDLRRGIDALRAHNQNVVKLGCAVGVLGYLGEQVVTRYNDSADAQVLVSDELPDLELEQRLLAGDCDLALLTNPVNPELMAVPLVDDYQFFWVNVNSRLATRAQIDVADLEGQTVVSMGDDFKNTGLFTRLCDEAGVHVKLRFTGEMMRVYETARNSTVLGLTCRNHIEATAESQRTVGIPFKCLPWGFSVCYRRDHILTDAQMHFLDYLRTFRRSYT